MSLMAFFTTVPLDMQAQINASETPDWVQRLKKKGLYEFDHSDLSENKQTLILQGKQWNPVTQEWEWRKTNVDSLNQNGIEYGKPKFTTNPFDNPSGDNVGTSIEFGDTTGFKRLFGVDYKMNFFNNEFNYFSTLQIWS
jgi:hypothetical protein